MKSEKQNFERAKEVPGFIDYGEVPHHLLGIEERKDEGEFYARKYGINNDYFWDNGVLRESDAMDFAGYLHDLDLKEENLSGKNILDIGSGNGGFKRAVEKTGLAKMCVALDEGKFNSAGMDVMGKAEKMPFKDESFDLELSRYSVPVMDATNGRFQFIPSVLREMVRVLRPGGDIKIHSICSYDSTYDEETISKHQKMKAVVLEEIERLHDEDPELEFKLEKLVYEDVNYRMRLTIHKKDRKP